MPSPSSNLQNWRFSVRHHFKNSVRHHFKKKTFILGFLGHWPGAALNPHHRGGGRAPGVEPSPRKSAYCAVEQRSQEAIPIQPSRQTRPEPPSRRYGSRGATIGHLHAAGRPYAHSGQFVGSGPRELSRRVVPWSPKGVQVPPRLLVSDVEPEEIGRAHSLLGAVHVMRWDHQPRSSELLRNTQFRKRRAY
jgi:hypothetical protein